MVKILRELPNVKPPKVPPCEGCPHQTGGGFVGTRGDPRADFAVVGEAPGSTELINGVPFTGQSGELLDRALTRSGFPNDGNMYITNALRCRPPVGSPIPPGTIDCCRSRLLGELAAHPRKIILALGGTAIRSILGKNDLKITQIRGQYFSTPLGVVIPTIHPAAVLRSPNDYKRMAEDIDYAVNLYLGKVQVRDPGKTEYTVVRTLENLERAIRGLLNKEYISADIETSGFNPRQDYILCLGIAWKKNQVLIFPGKVIRENIEAFRQLFSAPQLKWIWHNGKFDTSFLRNIGLPSRVDHDTMLMHYATNEMRGTHGLKQLASDRLGAQDYEEDLKPWLKGTDGSYTNIPSKVLYPYLARDCDYTLQLFDILKEEVANAKGLPDLYQKVLLPASHFLQTVEDTGVYVNKDALEVLRARLTGEKEQALLEMRESIATIWDAEYYADVTGAKKIPKEFNPGSWQQVCHVLYNLLKLRPPRGYNRDSQNATLLTLGDNPFVLGLLKYRKVSKALGTYVEGIEEEIELDDRVHTTFLIHGTATGRLSSAGPNMQNIPRDKQTRSMFQALPGRMLIEVDYSGAELRMLAHLSKDKFLTQVFVDGRDLHDEVSIAMYGPNFTSEQRMRAKACFSGDTEILTENGWNRFDQYNGITKIAQFVPQEGIEYNPIAGGKKLDHYSPGTIEFTVPENFQTFQSETMLHHVDRNVDLLLTPDHQVVYVDANSRLRRARADSLPNVKSGDGNFKAIIAGAKYDNTSTRTLDEGWTRILAMVVADGHFAEHSRTEKCHRIILGFTTVNKIERCRHLLQQMEIKFIESITSQEVTTFNIYSVEIAQKLLQFVSEKKELYWKVLHLLDGLVYLDEAQYWDSHIESERSNGLRVFFSTTRERTAHIMQAMAALNGVPSVLQRIKNHSPNALDSWKLSYRLSGRSVYWSTWNSTEIKGVQQVYCVQVPSGSIVVRRNGKVCIQGNCNFGIAYGRGGASLAQEFNLTLAEGEKLVEDWFARFPQAHRYIEACRLAPLLKKTMVTPLGRRRRFGLVLEQNMNNLSNESSNFPIQSTSSDLTLLSAIEAKAQLDKWEAWIINLVHDSILIECAYNLDLAWTIARYMISLMRETPKKWLNSVVPFDADCKMSLMGREGWGNLQKVKNEHLFGMNPDEYLQYLAEEAKKKAAEAVEAARLAEMAFV